MNTVLIGVMIYIGLQLLVGLLVSRRITSESDYLLAGRSLGYSLTTFSFFATWFGAETCVSSAGGLYEKGLAGGAAEPFGYALCVILLGLFFAVRLWKRGLTTIADFFAQRYSPTVEKLAVIILAPTSVFWAAAQIRAFGQVLSASSGAAVTTTITIAAAVVIVYTVSGGLRADVITDFVQGVLIIIGLVVLLFAIVGNLGGFHAVWAGIPSERLRFFGGSESSPWDIMEAWAIPVCGSLVAQELVSRVAASRTPQIASRSALMGGAMYLLIGMIPAFIGLIGINFMPDLKNPEQILPLLAQKHLSTFLYILFAGALVSAILSTVDSSLLAASALVSHNLLLPLRPGISEAAKVRMARIGVAVCGVIAWMLALSADTIYGLVEASSSFGGGGLFVLMVVGLFTKWGGRIAGLTTVLTSLTVWLSANLTGSPYAFIPSMFAALAAYLLAALAERWLASRMPQNLV